MRKNRSSRRALGRAIPRLIVGGYFVGHGAQKQFGFAGGHGLEATGAMFDSLGLKPGELTAQLAAGAELAGGALLALGIAPLVAGAPLIATMVTATRAVHLEKGPWIHDGGVEHPLVTIAAVMAIVDADSGPFAALLALLAGVAGSTAVMEMGKRA